MMMKNPETVSIEKVGAVAFVVVNNPPVNALSQAVRAGLLNAANALAADDEIKAIVIACAGRTFIAGADIREFGKPAVEPHLPNVIDQIEAMDKPVIAAIHGTALGGGFEVAIGCHYRIAERGAKVGLPEVNLGLIPGAGGCHRLPRLIGVEAAIDMIAGGAPVGADEALQMGAVDEIADGDLRVAANAFALRLIEEGATVRRTSEETTRISQVAPDVFERARAKFRKAKRGQMAPLRGIHAVEAGVRLPADEAQSACRDTFLQLRASRQSQALRHVFFAEREALKIPGLERAGEPAEINRAGVVGAGAMGAGIAMCFASAGVPVTLLDTSQENVVRGLSIIEKNYASSVAKKKMSDEKAKASLDLIKGATDYNALEGADIVVEAIYEDLELKKSVFKKLDEVCRPHAILATNTSYLDVNAIADATERRDKVLGLHFFNPAHVMKLLEIVRTERTSEETLNTALLLAKRLRKTSVVAGVCFGFIGNRMLNAYRTEALRLALEGAPIAAVDDAMFEFGMPMGPFALMDLTGLEVNVKMRAQTAPGDVEQATFAVVDRLYEAGRTGQRSGAGFYKYEEGSRAPVSDQTVDQWIAEEAEKQDVERRSDIGAEEIVERCMLTLANEGARILEEGVAIRSGDIDLAYIAGYGFPRHEGGPMFWAEQEGLDVVQDRLNHYHERFNLARWRPSDLIKRAAAAKTSLNDALSHQ
ncbi:MAG: 3-hydroxyacyl-CoA dehydrogenase NAD-binding domain-containing protein [Pseudomonadota bacterium]